MTKSLKLFLLSGLMLLCGVIASPLYGQSRTVSGVVSDDFGEPLFGAFELRRVRQTVHLPILTVGLN